MDSELLQSFVEAWQSLNADQFNALSAPLGACLQNQGEQVLDEDGNIVYGNLASLLEAASDAGLE